MRRRIVAAAAALCTLALLAGCVGGVASTTRTPKLSPPVIARPGILRAVVDLHYPPFAGTVQGERAGLDVDVAAAIADELGLKLELISGTPSAGAALVRNGTADLVLGGLTVDQSVSLQLAFAGTYVSDGPAVFAASGTTATIDSLETHTVAAQTGSAAYWALIDRLGADRVIGVGSLADAMRAVGSGKADLAAGDAIVGSYILRDFPRLHYIGQIGTAVPVGIGVSLAKPKLESDVRSILDRLAAEGVLATLRRKWAGDLPELTVSLPSVEVTSAGAATETTPAQ